MNTLISLAIWVSLVFLAFLLISKIYKKKSWIADMIITTVVLLLGLLWILLMAIMQYNEIAFPQEWWKFAPLSVLTIVIIVNALIGWGIISYTPELSQNPSAI